MVICPQRGADLRMAQLMPLPLTVCCSSKIQIGFTFLVPAHLGSPGKRAVKRVCVCVCVSHFSRLERIDSSTDSALYLGLLKERSLCNRLYLYMHLYSHKLQLHKQEIKKRKKKDTQRVKEHNVSNAY